ncbi:MAG: Ig-like domain-containing protein [Thermoguttaceae bacterium]|jgi:autotransporter-associated beta strand protein
MPIIARQSRRVKSLGLLCGGKHPRTLAIEKLESRHLLSATYYVDVAALGGVPSDNNTGTIDHPLATLQEALARAGPGDTVVMRGGTYDLANGNGPISFNKSGLPGAPLTIRAYPGEQPIIDLGLSLEWQMVSSGLWYGDLPAGSPFATVPSYITVQVRDGWTTTRIYGSAVDGAPPQEFTDPPVDYYQDNQLAYDLCWYDPSAQRVWLRSNAIQPIIAPDTQCAVVSSISQFHLNSGSWVDINGLQIQDGYFGLHLESQGHCDITNCRVLHCSDQGILGTSNFGEIADNYVDYVGGQLVHIWGGINHPDTDHDFYFSGIGTSIHDNFFGRSLSGYSGQIIAMGGGPAMTIANNVFYGGWQDGLTLYDYFGGENTILSGNVFISHPVVWRRIEQGISGSGMRIYEASPNADVTVSGNYVEGVFEGLVFSTLSQSQPTVPGIEIVGNTSVGGVWAGEIDGIPGQMDYNQWAGLPQMILYYPHVASFADYLLWAKPLGFEWKSTYHSATVLDPSQYDQLLVDDPSLASNWSLASVLSEFRQYAADQINAIAGLPLGTPTTIGGTSTPNVAGNTPVAKDDVYSVAAGGTILPGSVPSVLANDSQTGQTLTAEWFSGPEHGQLSLNADGTFTYTPAPGFYGVDHFVYRAYDASGGMAQATVTLNVSGRLTAFDDPYSLDSTSTLTVLAPGVLANDTLPGGETLSLSASQPQHGTLLMRSDGSFDYTPQPGYAGTDGFTDSFTYTIAGSDGETPTTATVTLTVQAAVPGVVAGPNGNDSFRIWRSPASPATINALSDSSGVVLTYSVAPTDILQWVVSGGLGEDILEVDYSNGDPLPSHGAYYDGGSYAPDGSGTDGNQLVLLGVNPDQDVHLAFGQFTVGSGEPLSFTNVQRYAVESNAVFGFYWWQQLALMLGTGNLVLDGSHGFVGDLDSGAGTIEIDAAASIQYLYVSINSQLAGDGDVTFRTDGFYLGEPGGLYYITYAGSTFDGTLSGPGLVEVEHGNLTLTGINSYSGGTTVESNGTLSVLDDRNLGAVPASATPGNIVINGGTLSAGTGFTLNDNRGIALGPASGSGPGTIDVPSGNLIYGGIIANNGNGSGSLIKTDAGTLTLTSNNTYSGGTTILGGTIVVTNGSALASGALSIDGGGLVLDAPLGPAVWMSAARVTSAAVADSATDSSSAAQAVPVTASQAPTVSAPATVASPATLSISASPADASIPLQPVSASPDPALALPAQPAQPATSDAQSATLVGSARRAAVGVSSGAGKATFKTVALPALTHPVHGRDGFSTSALAAGSHSIAIAYGGSAGFVAGSGSTSQQVGPAVTYSRETIWGLSQFSSDENGTVSVRSPVANRIHDAALLALWSDSGNA